MNESLLSKMFSWAYGNKTDKEIADEISSSEFKIMMSDGLGLLSERIKLMEKEIKSLKAELEVRDAIIQGSRGRTNELLRHILEELEWQGINSKRFKSIENTSRH